MLTSQQPTQLHHALDRFASKLDPAVAAGDQQEVHQWAEQVRAAFEALEDVLLTQRQRVHERLFHQVGEQDRREQKQIRELKEADKKVEQLLDVVKSQIIALCVQTSTEAEPRVDQQALCDVPVLEVIDRGSELVHWIRDQEAAVSIWFAETFTK